MAERLAAWRRCGAVPCAAQGAPAQADAATTPALGRDASTQGDTSWPFRREMERPRGGSVDLEGIPCGVQPAVCSPFDARPGLELHAGARACRKPRHAPQYPMRGNRGEIGTQYCLLSPPVRNRIVSRCTDLLGPSRLWTSTSVRCAGMFMIRRRGTRRRGFLRARPSPTCRRRGCAPSAAPPSQCTGKCDPGFSQPLRAA